jgi:molecular chaperone GrpE
LAEKEIMDEFRRAREEVARDEPDSLAETLEDEEGASSTGETPELAKEVEGLRKELSDATDRLMRQAAEFQNYRRRTEKEKSQMVSFGKSLVIQQLLDVVDDFHRSIEAGRNVDEPTGRGYESLLSGIELAYQKLMDELKKLGVEPIQSEGEPFNEEFHEAVMQQPVGPDEETGIVVTEIQRGYRMDDRVLRHAKVIVSSSQST